MDVRIEIDRFEEEIRSYPVRMRRLKYRRQGNFIFSAESHFMWISGLKLRHGDLQVLSYFA